MPKSFQCKAFDRWLSKNRGLFRHPPVIIKNRKNYFAMRFRDINSAIECTITSHGYSINVSNEGERNEARANDCKKMLILCSSNETSHN